MRIYLSEHSRIFIWVRAGVQIYLEDILDARYLGVFIFIFLGTTPSQSLLLQMHLMHGIWKITKRERESDTAIYPALFLKLIINVINKKVCV